MSDYNPKKQQSKPSESSQGDTSNKPFINRIKKKKPVEKPNLKLDWSGSTSFKMVATCMQNLEDLLEQELKDLGAKNVKALKRAVSFEGDLGLLYSANIWLRTALKVLRPVAHFNAKDQDALYKNAYAIPWEDIFSPDKSFAIDFAVNSSHFSHSQYAALRLKDAIVDRFRDKTRVRPDVDRSEADIKIHLHISEAQVDISLDSSGDPLFKRGYRQATHKAPINETLAAGMLLKAGWKGEQDFLDPMCGSGTLPIEAALIAGNIPPNLQRTHFGFENWADYNQSLLSDVLRSAQSEYKAITCKIIARDSNSQAIRACRQNINSAQMRKSIIIEQLDFFKSDAPLDEGLIVCNPPYGERIQTEEDLPDFYQKIGSTLKHSYPGWTAWFISSDMEALKQIGLKPAKKIPLMNGKLECQFRKFELFEGKLNDQD